MNFKHELSPSKPILRSTLSLILGTHRDLGSKTSEPETFEDVVTFVEWSHLYSGDSSGNEGQSL